jgi:hypothetical protein
MTEEPKPWRAEMPLGGLDRVAFAKMRIRANAELDALRAQLAERDARIAELTEWRSMSTAPDDWVLGRCLMEIEVVKRFPSGKFCDRDFRIREVTGWLPLPEAKP